MKGVSSLLALGLPLLFLLAFGAFVFLDRMAKQTEREKHASESEEVLEFRLLNATRFDEATKTPIHHPSLERLDGRRVVVAGYMMETPASERSDGFQRFRLVENAPKVRLRPPAANEGVFVEQRIPDGKDSGEAESFPRIDGSIAVRGTLRLSGYEGENPGLEKGYWFAIEDAVVDRLGAP